MENPTLGGTEGELSVTEGEKFRDQRYIRVHSPRDGTPVRRELGNKKLGGSGTHWGGRLGEQVRIMTGNGVRASESRSYAPVGSLRGWPCCSREPSER